jgi:hypothetical protein
LAELPLHCDCCGLLFGVAISFFIVSPSRCVIVLSGELLFDPLGNIALPPCNTATGAEANGLWEGFFLDELIDVRSAKASLCRNLFD